MNESMKPDASDDPRVRYAIERTLLAWVRTGLALLVSAEHLRLLRQIQSVPPFYSQWMGCR
jgi:uncharacterized membrane protein YidH (DUF202 family)